ncbi:hypothetical protein [Mycobacterium montefiorense]|uniref:hypothetical protein n=2 Tax=Mycobacterium montefiorense TaxID=154654 RepID=UPI0021F341B5|nr:hypothetical protein [Mycobacterium montefiorense]MCV7428061.1 hypothetical protein [Mycobacterium montefiorense]
MAISYSHLGVRHARTLLKDIAECGVKPPKTLTDLVDAYDDLAQASGVSDPMAALVRVVATGQVRGQELDEQISAAAAAVHVQEFRRGLQQRVEPAVMQQFVEALDEGGCADAVIDSLRPQFDEAAQKLTACAELVTPGADPETFLASATSEQIQSWQSIDEHVATLTKISSAVSHFGPHSTSFPLSEVPGNTGAHAGFVNNNGVMCVDPQWSLVHGCELFSGYGSHRNSPWFKGASVLKLNSVAETREKIRAWAESAWEALNLNQGRGRLEPGTGFVAEPIRNPYKLAAAKG